MGLSADTRSPASATAPGGRNPVIRSKEENVMVLDEKRKEVLEAPTEPQTTYEIEDDEDSQFASAMAQRAVLLIDKGKVRAAEKCLRVGLERSTEHPECLSYLAICVAMRDRKFVTAEKLAKQVVQRFPEEGRAHYALGRVNLAGARRKFAFRHFERSRSLAPDDELLAEDLDRLEPRRLPILTFLPRHHPLNHFLGWLRARLMPDGSDS